MISVINSSNDSLDLLVKLIGVDLTIFDNKKFDRDRHKAKQLLERAR